MKPTLESSAARVLHRAGTRLRSDGHRSDAGMTLMELLIAGTLLVVLLTIVGVTMSMVENVSTAVNTQYQEFDQAVPALAPLQEFLRAEVEPAPTAYTKTSASPPTPGFLSVGNFSLTFYSDVGTSYNNYVVTANGRTTAGPAKIVAQLVDSTGAPITSSMQQCNTTTPCSFQVLRYLPSLQSNGLPTCPVNVAGAGSACQYPTNYTLVTNVEDVVNDPSQTSGGAPTEPVFSYTVFDPDTGAGGTAISMSAADVQNQQLTLTGYPTTTSQNLSICSLPNQNGNYPTIAISCPRDAIQSVGVDLMIAAKGSGGGTVNNQTVVYRYAENPGGSPLYPYQYTSAVG
jgi:hypothetical protein